MTDTTPHLARLDRAGGDEDATIEWARFLGETFGTTGALNCLRYYEHMGWITPGVREGMTTYLRGLSLGEIHNKRFDEPTTLDYPLESLSGTLFGAHAKSLQYIARINDDDLEEHVMIARMAERRVDRRLGDDAGTDASGELANLIQDGSSASD